MKKILNYLIMIILLYSCKSKVADSSVLDTNNIETQSFRININRDTSLVTKAGIIIKIRKGDITSDASSDINLNVKEALDIVDMVKAGLYTKSNGVPLSSGGMFFINVDDGDDVKISKSISVYVPTDLYNNDMNVYSGSKKDDFINWENPQKIDENDEIQKSILDGEILYKSNCASCHRIDKELAGPSLAGITDRLPMRWLYDFTRNPASMLEKSFSKSENILPIDKYTCCIFDKWKPTLMTSFSVLSDDDLKNIYSFIKVESDKLQDNSINFQSDCFSCAFGENNEATAYDSAYDYINFSRSIPVNSDTVRGTYYPLNVNYFGWYNIDILLENIDRCEESEVFVKVEEQLNAEEDVVALIIPSFKVFVNGYSDSESNNFVFASNGKIFLPRGEKCYILSFKALNDKKVSYAIQSFIATAQNKISLQHQIISIVEFYKEIEAIGLNSKQEKLLQTSVINESDQPNAVNIENKEVQNIVSCGCSKSAQ